MGDRRKLLASRLKDFVNNKMLNPYLPVKPVKLMGFGSFFRGKNDPHDIDLSLVVSPHPDFAVTADTMDGKIENSWHQLLEAQWCKLGCTNPTPEPSIFLVLYQS